VGLHPTRLAFAEAPHRLHDTRRGQQKGAGNCIGSPFDQFVEFDTSVH